MSTRASPRDRLIDTAADLFYERGLPSIGINEVTDRAGVARMTLYNNFDSKEALALAAFERQAEARRALIEKRLKRARTPTEAVGAMFDVSEQFAMKSGFRGCPFINVVVQGPHPEGPMHALVRTHKAWIRAKFREQRRPGVGNRIRRPSNCLPCWAARASKRSSKAALSPSWQAGKPLKFF
jgi:AcrR family transcriptional regulator